MMTSHIFGYCQGSWFKASLTDRQTDRQTDRPKTHNIHNIQATYHSLASITSITSAGLTSSQPLPPRKPWTLSLCFPPPTQPPHTTLSLSEGGEVSRWPPRPWQWPTSVSPPSDGGPRCPWASWWRRAGPPEPPAPPITTSSWLQVRRCCVVSLLGRSGGGETPWVSSHLGHHAGEHVEHTWKPWGRVDCQSLFHISLLCRRPRATV